MKLLLVHNAYQHPGGEDQVFASELELLASNGHEVVSYTVHNDAVRGLSKLSLACRTSWSRTAYRDLRAVLRRERPQIVHVHNTVPLISPAVYFAAGEAGVPVVQTLHNYRLLCPKSVLLRDRHICEDCLGRRMPWPGILHACYRESRAATSAVAMMLGIHGLLGTWTRRVTRYIALTEFMRWKFIEGGLPADRISVKPNFIAPDPGMGEHHERYALFVGRLSEEKGIQTLTRGWRHLDRAVPLKIAGAGSLRSLSDGAPACIEWLGQRSRGEVLALMREAQFLVFPAEWYEGFPLTIAEAFATGLPVVASRLGAMAELVEDGRTGLLFNPGDPVDLAAKVAWAADHPNELAEMGRRARQEFNAKYTAERNYQYLCHIYQQVIGACASAEQGGMASPAASSGVRSQSLTAGRRRSIACGPVP